MRSMDLEIVRGLSALCGNDPAQMQAMMGSMMGAWESSLVPYDPQAMLGFGFPEQYNALAGLMGAMGAMMGAARPYGRRAPFTAHPGGGAWGQMQSPWGHTPAGAYHPVQAIQPALPGVPARGGRVQPLGFQNGAFVAGGSAVVTVIARPQRPFRGGRLVGSLTRTGASATGLVTLVSLTVATDGQLLSGDPISFDALAPQSFGVQVDLSPAAVGNEIIAQVAVSVLPTMTDRIDFNLTVFGHTIG
jgi:hypothetical protein